MKLVAAAILALSLFGAAAVRAQDAEAITKAQAAAGQWLALTDAERYAASWEQAAVLFRSAVSQPSWETSMRGARAPLGAVKARKLKSAQFTTALPGAPDGEYVVLQFNTQFENKASAVETVTPLKDEDGAWRVSGYRIR